MVGLKNYFYSGLTIRLLIGIHQPKIATTMPRLLTSYENTLESPDEMICMTLRKR
ncbi:uncharacterized protein METZ01_LOCUS368439 [marine metagenome]|uniref:Uncharacterized protein n=1 Tax=marine metagenome TaxID=408172 RepID=A0A382T1F1_9ZZZZ